MNLLSKRLLGSGQERERTDKKEPRTVSECTDELSH